MKIRYLLLGISLLISGISLGQRKQTHIIHRDTVFGRNLIDSTEIRGTKFVFPERIEKTYYDTTTQLLTIQLRGIRKIDDLPKNKGKILQYNLNEHKLLWTEKINYQYSSLQQYNNIMIYAASTRSYFMDAETGKDSLELNNRIFYTDLKAPIALGYRFDEKLALSNKLDGINLRNGSVLWTRTITKKFDWNELLHLNDSTILISASGLHTVNIHNGKGWDYTTRTGKNDYKGTVAANLLGIASGIFTGFYFITLEHAEVRDIVSNSLIDSTAVYLASRDQLAGVDMQTGAVLWKYVFPKYYGSKSSLFMNDSMVVMINNGYAALGNKNIFFGKPFISAFNKVSGQQKYFTIFYTKKDPILGFKRVNNVLYLIFQHRIGKYSIDKGNLIIEKDFPEEKYGTMSSFTGKQSFISNDDGQFISLNQSDSTKIYIRTKQKKTLVMDHNLNITDTIPYKNISTKYLHIKNHTFLEKDWQTTIIDNTGNKVAVLNVTPKARLFGKTLFDQYYNFFMAIDLKDVLKKD